MANKGNPSAWESVVAGAWDGNVEDFVIRKSMNKDGKMEPRGKEVDIAILSKTKGTVYEVTYNGDTRSIVRTKEIKVEGSAELNNAVASVSYWNNIIEIELPGGTNSYIVNGYISNDNNNICISVGRNQFVKIPSSSKLVSYRLVSAPPSHRDESGGWMLLCDLQQIPSVYRCVGTASRWKTSTDQE
jgi:hypothetical protein